MITSYSKKLEVGVDEAGRGALAGPVFAAAVILPKGFFHPLINDSKILSETKRYELREIILNNALDWSVAFVNPELIDKINILNAAIETMHLALEKLAITPELILVDGNKFKPFKNIPHKTIVKGDGKIISIAAASILAKTFRDDFMKNIHNEFPEFKWHQNKGYATKFHKEAILKYGLTKYHRRSFCNFYFQKKIEF